MLTTWLVRLAWLDFVQVTALTFVGTAKPEVLGLGIPTLLTQMLLILGMGLGSNVARLSYVFWTVLALLLEVAGGGSVYPSTTPYADQWTAIGYVFTAVLLLGLLSPSVHRHFVEIAMARSRAPVPTRRQRYRRNLWLGALWALVTPVSLVAGWVLGTPALAVVLSAAASILVATFVVFRQLLKLHRS